MLGWDMIIRSLGMKVSHNWFIWLSFS